MNYQITNAKLRDQAASQHLRSTRMIGALKKSHLAGAGALVLALGGFWYFTHDDGAKALKRNLAAPVKVATVTERNMAVVEHTIGTVMANIAVQVVPRVQGTITAAHFKEGQVVKEGDLLFQIDPRPYQAALDLAQAQLAKDQAQLTLALSDENRYKTLFAQNAVSSQQRDTAVATAASDQATVLADRAAVKTAELNLEYTKIRSPIDGKTGPMLIQPGNMVPSSGTNSLVTINQIQPIKVSFFLPQSDLPRMQARQKAQKLVATINQHDEGGQTISAPVNFISNSVTNTSGTIELRSSFENQDGALVPGQLVDVTVDLADIPKAVIVPRESINTGPNGQFVYVVTPQKRALERAVKVLFDDGTNAAIEGKVKAGQKVIIDGQLRVVPGAGVYVEGGDNSSKASDVP